MEAGELERLTYASPLEVGGYLTRASSVTRPRLAAGLSGLTGLSTRLTGTGLAGLTGLGTGLTTRLCTRLTGTGLAGLTGLGAGLTTRLCTRLTGTGLAGLTGLGTGLTTRLSRLTGLARLTRLGARLTCSLNVQLRRAATFGRDERDSMRTGPRILGVHVDRPRVFLSLRHRDGTRCGSVRCQIRTWQIARFGQHDTAVRRLESRELADVFRERHVEPHCLLTRLNLSGGDRSGALLCAQVERRRNERRTQREYRHASCEGLHEFNSCVNVSFAIGPVGPVRPSQV
jgi:hypothetical protein